MSRKRRRNPADGPPALGSPLVVDTAALAGILNATRKVVYLVVDALPRDQKQTVVEGIAEIIEVVERDMPTLTPEAASEVGLLRAILERTETT